MANTRRSSKQNAFKAAKSNLVSVPSTTSDNLVSYNVDTFEEKPKSVDTITNDTEKKVVEEIVEPVKEAVPSPVIPDSKGDAYVAKKISKNDDSLATTYKNIRRQILIRKSHDEWLRKTSKENGISVNELICILIETNME